MAINFHEDCKVRLIEAIIEALSKIKIDNNVHLNYKSTLGLEVLDSIPPKTGSIRKQLDEYVGERSLSTFIYETLSREISENNSFDSETKGVALNTVTTYTDLKNVAERLLEQFINLPSEFLVSFRLPSSISKNLKIGIEKQLEFNDSIRLVIPDVTYNDNYELQSGIEGRDTGLFGSYWIFENLERDKRLEWDSDSVYIQFEEQGFVGRYDVTPPIERVIADLKAFMGLSIALNLLTYKGRGLIRTPVQHLIIHKQIAEKWEIWDTYKLSMELADVINNSEVSLDEEQSPEDQKQHIKLMLYLIGRVYKNPQGKTKRLLLASQWFLDSYQSKNDTVAFVNTMTAMEVLLGKKESNDIGVGELLRNRCAYFIGQDHDDIEQILKEFPEIYQVRSDILHKGQNKLYDREKSMFFKLRRLCRLVIYKELQLLLDTKEKK